MGWFKSNDVGASTKPRGVINLDKVASVCGATKSDAGRVVLSIHTFVTV